MNMSHPFMILSHLVFQFGPLPRIEKLFKIILLLAEVPGAGRDRMLLKKSVQIWITGPKT
jgi:hypothetical protein